MTRMDSEQQNTWAVETKGLSKFFGHIIALHEVNIKVPYHQLVTIIGPNGAGKSTLMRILSTLSRPSRGQVYVDGLDVGKWGAEIRRRVGYATHQPLLYNDLSVCENLRFFGHMYGVTDLETRIQQLLAKVELLDRQHDTVRTLSRGMQQRLAIARAVLHNPTILLLDEPYAGLDQHATELLTHLLHEWLSSGCTILMTTHDLNWAAKISDKVLVLLNGRLVHQTEASALSEKHIHELYRQYAGGGQ
jgi:heme exporter protein A